MHSVLSRFFDIQPPTAARLAGRHLSYNLMEKRRIRWQASSMLLVVLGPATLPLLLSFFVWLHPNVPPLIQIGVLVLLHSWAMVWLLCNKNGLLPNESCQWHQSVAESRPLRCWTGLIQCWLLYQYALLLMAFLIVSLYVVMPHTASWIDNTATTSGNTQVMPRALLVTAYLFLTQWLYLAKTPYRYSFVSVLIFSVGIFYGNEYFGLLILLLQSLALWFITARPIKPQPPTNHEYWLKLPYNARLLLGATLENPALWCYPLMLFTLCLIFFAAYFYFDLLKQQYTLLLCQVGISAMAGIILWRASQQWASSLRREGAYTLSLPLKNRYICLKSTLIFLMGLPTFVCIWALSP